MFFFVYQRVPSCWLKGILEMVVSIPMVWVDCPSIQDVLGISYSRIWMKHAKPVLSELLARL